MIFYRHRQSNNVYRHVAYGRNYTSGERNGNIVVIYQPLFNTDPVYVTDAAEHAEEFDTFEYAWDALYGNKDVINREYAL